MKRDLGADAVILSTRTYKRGGLLGVGRKVIFELTATTADEAGMTATRPRTPRAAISAYGAVSRRSRTAERRAEPVGGGAFAGTGAARATDDLDELSDQEKTRALARAMLRDHEARRSRSPQSGPVSVAAPAAVPEVIDGSDSAATGVATGEGASTVDTTPGGADGAARRFVLTPTDAVPPVERPAPMPAVETAAMHDELTAIRRMVGQVLDRQVKSGDSAAPSGSRLFDFYLQLVGQEMSDALADDIVGRVRQELGEECIDDEDAIRAALECELARLVPVAPEIDLDAGDREGPFVIALVGPTGVGKTTTVAKLAASFKLHQKRQVGLITADTYRIAAVDQLRTYANIIGLQLEVALTPAEMRQAVHALSDCDVVLIDTAGRSQNDAERIRELRAFVREADPDEVHLVLSGTASEKVLLREAEAFGAVGVHKIVLTKLDEAVSFGMLIDVVRQLGKELSFFTTGQEVPDHIEVSQPQRLVEFLLGASAPRLEDAVS